MLVFPLREVCFIYFISLAHLVLACGPSIAIRFSAAIALFARAPSVSVCKFEVSVEGGKAHGCSGVRKFEELDAVRDHAQSGEGACCDCRVLNPPVCVRVFFAHSPGAKPVCVRVFFAHFPGAKPARHQATREALGGPD